ncbi:CLAVATA3/ESR (CLE)-related protein 9 [Camellia lanceoleosa]|uniref:CLAVATA3/ESR (CLE)-related protein 9 n=1 Tax=Camellia lanceoleosa TaxID=1840588 RepID=A0ACC0G4J0_9ERIC|nr:CLAVATA3/ESR (CLE)-related protein 9 [Camellia lanceoleosa]
MLCEELSTSSSSTMLSSHRLQILTLVLLLLLLILLSSSSSIQSYNTISAETPSSTSTRYDLLPRIRHGPPLPPPPSPLDHDSEIDPRYGVEKRLVPSGPNPLHN